MYLIDTNILIYHFANHIPVNAQETIDKLFKNHFNVSVITKIEFLGWKNFTDKQLKKAKEFLDFATVINLRTLMGSRSRFTIPLNIYSLSIFDLSRDFKRFNEVLLI